MRRISFFALIFILAFGLHTTIYAEDGLFDTIKIGLFYGSTAKESILIASDGGFALGHEENGEFITDTELGETNITVTASADGSICVGNYIYDPSAFPTLYPIEGNIFIGGVEYRGGVQFKRIDGGALTIINVVGIEPYLYSVIGKEMSPSWNIEALKAQAVCARGFAISNYNKFQKYGFNLDDTTSSQVYKGVSTERDSTRKAVDETKGLVLKHDGKIIQSIYCASMGGASANAENVWGGKYPYLVSVKDPYENPKEATRYSWTVTLTNEEIKNILKSSKVDIGDILNVTIDEQDDAGYVTKLTFHGTEDTYTVTRSNCRTIFGGKLHSQRYTIEGSARASEKITLSAPDISCDISSSSSLFGGSILNILKAVKQGFTESVADVPSHNNGQVTFNGNGWGHGVGMSQWGAKAMADSGKGFEEILTFYYTGTYLENIY